MGRGPGPGGGGGQVRPLPRRARRAGVSRSPAPGARESRPRSPRAPPPGPHPPGPRPRRCLGLVPGRPQPVRGPSRHDVGRVAAAVRGRGAPGTPGLRRHRPLRDLVRYGEGGAAGKGSRRAGWSSEDCGVGGTWLGVSGAGPFRGPRTRASARGDPGGVNCVTGGVGRRGRSQRASCMTRGAVGWGSRVPPAQAAAGLGMPEKPAAPGRPRPAWGHRGLPCPLPG